MVLKVTHEFHASLAERAAARRLYESEDIQIDGDACSSPADVGAWVQAWVWVPAEDIERTRE